MMMALATRGALGLIAAALLFALQLSPALAQTSDEFYRSNDINLVVAADVGGGYDLYARASAPYLKRHIASHPNVIVQNMPGAGGIRMANYMALNAKPDGSVIGLTLSPVLLNQLIQPAQVRYDAGAFVWIGTIDAQTNVLFVSGRSSVRSIDDAKRVAVTIGATNASSFLYQEPAVMNAFLGTKFKIVSGYKGVRDLNLALERGEIDGQVNPWSSLKSEHPDWMSSGKVFTIIATGARAADLPGVPLLADLVKDESAKSLVALLDSSSILGRSIAAPRGTPADRVAVLRNALAAAVKDPEFVAETEKHALPVQYRSGEELEAFVKQTLKTPPEAVKTFLGLVSSP
jgi:tripartite-type tricarboxylate transporter receptor subunit TctC